MLYVFARLMATSPFIISIFKSSLAGKDERSWARTLAGIISKLFVDLVSLRTDAGLWVKKAEGSEGHFLELLRNGGRNFPSFASWFTLGIRRLSEGKPSAHMFSSENFYTPLTQTCFYRREHPRLETMKSILILKVKASFVALNIQHKSLGHHKPIFWRHKPQRHARSATIVFHRTSAQDSDVSNKNNVFPDSSICRI